MTKQRDYISQHMNDVMVATEGSGIFPEVAISQSALESAWGESLLAKKYNNFFGIKATPDWKGKTITLKTKEVYDGIESTVSGTFRAYNSFSESVRDYVKFLKENPRYQKGGVFTAKSPEEQVKRLKDSGYATSLVYTNSVIKTIYSNYDLIKSKISEYLQNNPLKALATIIIFGIVGYYGYKFYKLKK